MNASLEKKQVASTKWQYTASLYPVNSNLKGDIIIVSRSLGRRQPSPDFSAYVGIFLVAAPRPARYLRGV